MFKFLSETVALGKDWNEVAVSFCCSEREDWLES